MIQSDNKNTRASDAGVLKMIFGEIGFKKTLPIFLPLALIIGVSMNFSVAGLVNLISIPENWLNDYRTASESMRNPTIIKAVFTALITPIIEEILFRGLICGTLRRLSPKWFCVAVSTLIFAILHQTPFWIAYAALAGIVLGCVFMTSESLYPCFILHVSFNSVSYIWKILKAPGTKAQMITFFAVSAAVFILSLAAFTLIYLKNKIKIRN